MKTRIIFSILLMFSFSSFSQTLHVHKNDGSIVSIDLSLIEKITFTLEDDNSFTDPRDGSVYNYIELGNQTWMSQNLAYLPDVDPPSEGDNGEVHYYVYDYEGSSVSEAKATSNYMAYGALYSWDAALTACPDGWHLPSQEDWNTLVAYLGEDPGTQMKSTTGWHLDGNGTNSSGFNAFPLGYRSSTHQFTSIGTFAYLWSSSETDDNHAYRTSMAYNSFEVDTGSNGYKEFGHMVRCLKD